ncbi:MAG TPA: OB-fold domain-containing protein [Alphaproteobacteria bacterium]|nr:OB-fold domain-containing protein [Alphaproteobacteria bacterium]
MSVYAKPLPRLDDANAPFWAAAKAHELKLQKCADCSTLRFPATRHCASCGSTKSGWEAVSGRGTVESWCRFHQVYFEGFGTEVPYTVIVVRLNEGPRLFSNLVGASAGGHESEIEIGLPVDVYFDDVTPEVTLVKFKPAT